MGKNLSIICHGLPSCSYNYEFKLLWYNYREEITSYEDFEVDSGEQLSSLSTDQSFKCEDDSV